MKSRKIILVSSLFLFLISNYIKAQTNTKEDLGKALVKSIQDNDLTSYKSLLIPKEVTLSLEEGLDTDDMAQEERDSLMAQYEAAYEANIVPRYEKNFMEMVNLSDSHKIDWTKASFMILYKDSSKGEDYIPFFMHTKLNGSVYKHFYFGTVRYKGKWYLSGNMEITKGEKYGSN